MATENDKLVLNTIFNPFEPNNKFELDETETETCILDDHHFNIDQQLIKKLKEIEIEAISLAENGKLNESLEKFNKLISMAPEYLSGYNNRAQTYQLLGKSDLAVQDLEFAIHKLDKQDKKCPKIKNILGQAFCQRALIFRFNKKEEECYEYFKKAASLGNKFAKKQVVLLNPYAALCNQMLNEMMNKLKNKS